MSPALTPRSTRQLELPVVIDAAGQRMTLDRAAQRSEQRSVVRSLRTSGAAVKAEERSVP